MSSFLFLPFLWFKSMILDLTPSFIWFIGKQKKSFPIFFKFPFLHVFSPSGFLFLLFLGFSFGLSLIRDLMVQI